MYYSTQLPILLIFAVASVFSQSVGPSVTVRNMRLFYGNSEYWVNGMAYSPSPLAKVIDGQNYGTGLCTPKRAYTPGSYTNIQMTSPCYMEDYFDGTVYPGFPSAGLFNAVWQRDFPMIKSLGVNTLRIYHVDPITSKAVASNSNYADKTIIGANHIPFLDLAQSYGFKVVFPLYADESAVDGLSQTFMFQYIENLIDEVGYHPAILMYQFGNELQFSSNGQAYVTKINTYLQHARSYQIQKWGRTIPVSTALIDYPPYYNSLVPALSVDIVTTNAGYRGFDFQNLFSGGDPSFLGLKTLGCQSGKPILIGEMGVHSGQASSAQFDIPSFFPQIFTSLISHKPDGAIGGFLFEWQEEHWKGVPTTSTDWTQEPDVYMGLIKLTPGTGTFPVDIAVKKYGTSYDWNGATQAFALNPFAAAGQLTLTQSQSNLCAGISGAQYSAGPYTGVVNTGSVTPTTGSPVVVNPSPSPSTSSSSTPATSSSSNYCPSWLTQCGSACYRPSEYTCSNNLLARVGAAGASSTSTPTTGSNNGDVFPPVTGGQCGAMASCNGQCYSPNQYTCTKDKANGNPVLCYGTSNTASCSGACYSTTQYKCVNGGLQWGSQ